MNRNEVLAALFLMAALSPSVAQAQVITLPRADIAASVGDGVLHPPDAPLSLASVRLKARLLPLLGFQYGFR